LEYENKMSEMRENAAIAEQVAHEYHSGKFDITKIGGMKFKKKKK
jgi:hypothetical protein